MEEQKVKRRLAAIVAVDVAGFSRLTSDDEENTLLALRQHRAEAIDPAIANFGGRIANTAGDSLLIEFPSVVDALRCAIRVQREMVDRNAAVPEQRQIRFRVGVNLGDVVEDDGDILGDGVNVAARLESLAEPGGILLSRAARDQVRDRIDIQLEDLGDVEVKNIARPVRTFRVALDGAVRKRGPISRRSSTGSHAPEKQNALSLAVLPFINQSNDPEQEYFADGLTEDLIAAMGRFHSVAVIARNSAFHYKGQSPLVTQIGAELGVDYLVEGSVRTSGNRIRVSAQLTETSEGKQLWAERYDRDLKDVFAVQDDVVSAIAAELGIKLTTAAETRSRSLPPESLTAYDLLLKGRAAWWRGNVNEGFKLVEEAAAIDPTYAAAQAWLALQHAYQGYSASMGLDPEELGPKSRALAKRALELDDRDPFIHMAASMSFGFTRGGDKEQGLRHIEIAASMNPNDSEIMLLRAWHLAFFGEFDRALELAEQVRKLNPIGSPVVSECLADVYYMMGDYKRCLATYEHWFDAPPQALTVFAACHAQLGSSQDEVKRCLDGSISNADGDFDPQRFAKVQISVCARQSDADHWREGFRKAGLDV